MANNAAWSLGELASKGYVKTINQPIARSIPTLWHVLIQAHNTKRQPNKEDEEDDDQSNDGVYLGNVAVCLARLLSLDPNFIGFNLTQAFLDAWQSAMSQVGDGAERQEAIQGMQLVLEASKSRSFRL